MLQESINRTKQQHIYEFTSFGGIIIYLLTAIFFLFLGNLGMFYRLLIGIFLIYLIVITIKIFYFKNRPRKYKYSNFIEKIDASSFPSVHSARSAFLAAALMNYFGNFAVSITLTILVAVVAYSRIYLKTHDVRDVAAGIALGLALFFIVSWH